jgi:hypothetical protein
MNRYWMVEVRWVNPQTGRFASPDKMLSLDCGENAPFVAYKGPDEFSDNREAYLFSRKREAESFKHCVESGYAASPSYFVIDERHEPVLDENGKPIVAWEPDIHISAVSEKQAAEIYPAHFAELLEDRKFLKQCGIAT